MSDSLQPKDWSPPGSSVYESLQARILESIAMPSDDNRKALQREEEKHGNLEQGY